MAQSIGNIQLDLGVNTSGFKKQLLSLGKTTQAQTNSMAGMFGKLGKVVAATFAIGKIVSFSKACIELGSDLAEVQNVVDVTYGSMSKQVNDFAKNAMESYGLSEKVAKQYMGTFGAMSKSFGYTTEAAYDQAAALTALAGDVASFYNITTDEAYTKLKSVFTGETESLKELGVVMTQTALDEYALQKGMGKTTAKMSEQEKVALRLAFVQDRLSTASGDFARTSDGWANQVRVLGLRFDALKATIGQGLINALLPLLRVLNELIAKLQVVAEKFRAFTAAVFGDAGGTSSAVSEVVGSTDAISSNIGSAVDSAKKLRKQLSGFDELNILGGNSDSSSSDEGSSGVVPTVTKPLDTGKSTISMTSDEIDKIKSKLQNVLGIAGMIGSAILGWKLGSFIADLATAGMKATGLKESIMLLGKQLALTVGVTLAVTGITLEIKGIASAVQDELNGINFAEILGGGGLLTGGAALIGLKFGAVLLSTGIGAVIAGLPALFVGIYDAIKNGINWLSGLLIPIAATAVGTGIGVIVGAAGGPAGSIAAGALIGLAVGVLSTISILIYQKWDEICKFFAPVAEWVDKNILQPIKDIISPFTTWFDQEIIQPIIAFFKPIVQTFADAFEYAKEKYTEIKNGVIAALTAIKDKVVEIFKKYLEVYAALWMVFKEYLWKPIVDKLTTFYKDKIKPIVDAVREAFIKIGSWFKEHVIDPIVAKFEWIKDKLRIFRDWVVDLFKKISTAVADFISGAIKKVINSVLSIIENKINMFIRLLNGTIDTLNSFPGVNISKVAELSIPRLATGGYVEANSPQLAVIGDNKREGEIVAPESKIAEAVAAGVAVAMRQFVGLMGNKTEQRTPLVIKIGEEDFWSGFIDYHNSVVKRTGDTPLLI